jgi:hypothetical protein
MLYHFDYNQGAVLSKHSCGQLPLPHPLKGNLITGLNCPGESSPSRSGEGGISFSPPFVLCTAMSSTGIIAVGTADGRIWIGLGGEKATTATSGKKRARKWGGLTNDAALDVVIADGPIVGV